MLSGGQLFINRPILLSVLAILAITYAKGSLLKFKRINSLFFIVLVITIEWILRIDDHIFMPILIRYLNFFSAVIILVIYLNSPGGILLFRKDLYIILFWISLGAIINFIIANFFSSVFYTINTTDGSSINSLFYIFNYHESVANQYNLVRPDFVFYEPGVLQIYINIFLYLSLFIYNNKKNSLIALISVFFTLSTTGIIITLIILIFFYFKFIIKNNSKFKIFNIIILGLLIIPFFYLLSQNIGDKLNGEAIGSSIAREYDFYTGLEIIKQYPILGIGFDHARYISLSGVNYYSDTLLTGDSIEDRPSSNGLINLFYSIGIFLGSLYLFLLYRQKLLPDKILIFIIMLLSLFGESLVFTPFFLLFVCSSSVIFRLNNQ
ncbi:O-antigen ligase family protein [Polynucleobacter sphagniphilus]|uniref:O-antigen ligase family protein n=1 Tax=Polynucleobacter sphagniphilus TaxID=1743169 RepID=UPI002476AB03|nr:O-antigen ligase family protein [Polynucleobacter sphagniphilus]